MSGRNSRLDTYFAKDEPWRAELSALREIVLGFPVDEVLRWRQPVYQVGGKNFLILSIFKAGATIGFFRGALLKDPAGLLHMPGPNSQSVRHMVFTSLDEVAENAPNVRDYVAEAIAIHKSGKKVDLTAIKNLTCPDELQERLDQDSALRAAFAALTPGRQRSYIMHIDAAKQSATRTGRVDRAVPKIFEGKGFNEY